MNILKRQLALLLVFAMILTMLPMPAHADEVTEPESPSAIVEETAEKPVVSNEEVSTDTANKSVESADSDTTAKENAVPVVETPVDSDAALAEELVSDPMEESEKVIETNDTSENSEVEEKAGDDSTVDSAESDETMETDDTAEDAEVEENTDSDATVESEEDSSTADDDESEETKDSEADTQEETEQVVSEAEAPVTATFSLRRSAANAAADCAHENTTFVVDSREDYWYYLHTNEAQHVANYYAGYKCDDCGVMVSQVHNYFAEDHVMNENSVCTLCGYGAEEDSCAHSETEVAWDTNYTLTYTSVNSTQHKVSGYQYTYCTSCFERVGESFAAEEMDNHEPEADGDCTLCGYTSSENTDCAHKNTEEKFYYNNPVRYAQFNEEEHYIYRSGTIYCHDCRTDIGSSNTEMWSFEAHTLNDEGNCIYCGYGLGEDYCTHPNSKLVLDTDQPKAYYKKDENQHLVNFYQYHYCLSCNNRISESFMDAAWEDHDFDAAGVCTLCGDSACDHSSWAQDWDTTQTITYAKYTATYHKKSGYQYSYCTNCLERGGESFASEINEAHTFDSLGVCTLCGYDPNDGSGCNHENVITGYAPLYEPPRYAQCNETQHLVYRTMYDRCLDCNQVISEGFEAASLENHVLNDDGKCTYCGYGFGEDYCTHPASDVMWSKATMTYTSLNEEQHQVEGCQYHYCTSCYRRISADFPVVEWENHTFDSAGDCTLCDYRVGCAHSETTMKLYDTLYESLNKDSHEVTRLYSKVCADPDCGKVLVSVETSYTETDIEDHDFTGNACHLCNYTVADQLCATVTASGLTANKGDNISATVSVVGGTGGYQFSWKILKDGSVVAENPITTSASCGTNAYEEGSFVFQVTVTDSGGNTVTAQSSNITVSHGCQYETVSNTVLVIQSATHHTVETTTYEECTICHETRNEVKDVDWVEHTPVDANSYGHEAAHDHKKYYICECGAHPYLEGQFHTANGEVQEPDVCCICHDHKYGEEEETSEGTRQKTCANCGLTTVTHTHEYELVQTTELINPDETKHYAKTKSTQKCKTCGHEKPGIEVTIEESHSPKNPKDYTYRTAHPHQRYAVCECGKEFNVPGEYEKVNGKLLEPDVCCICHGHKFGEPTVGYGGDWYRICKNCYFTEVTSNPNEPEYIPPEDVNTIFCKHEYSCYYDSQLKLHYYCTLCQSRTATQAAEDEENYKRYIDSQIRATAEDARHKAALLKDEGMYILKALHDENEGFWKDMGTSLYKVYTFQWRDVIYREFGYSENVNEIRKLAIQTAVANTKISQNRSKNTLTVSSHQQVMEDNLEDLPDNIKLVGDFFIDVGDHSHSVAEFLISSDANTKVSILESIDWKSYTDGVRTGKTKVSAKLVGAKLLLESSLELGDYMAWSEAQQELFYANINRGTEDILFLQELIAANPNDKILVQYCEDTIEGIQLKLNGNELIETINNLGETAGDVLKIFAVNTAETTADIGMPAALYAGIGFTAGKASIATFAGTITGFFTELFLGTNTTNDAYDDIEILYEHLVNQIYSYQEIQDDSSISDSTKLFQEYYILYLKTAGMELAGELHKGANKDITDGIVSIYEKYEHQMLYE